MNSEQWKMKKEAFESRSLRSGDVTSGDVPVQIRKGKKTLAITAQALSEPERKPPAKAAGYAMTLHVRARSGTTEGSLPPAAKVTTRE